MWTMGGVGRQPWRLHVPNSARVPRNLVIRVRKRLLDESGRSSLQTILYDPVVAALTAVAEFGTCNLQGCRPTPPQDRIISTRGIPAESVERTDIAHQGNGEEQEVLPQSNPPAITDDQRRTAQPSSIKQGAHNA